MEYHHILVEGEIKSGRIYIARKHVTGDVYDWLDQRTNQSLSIYFSDGTLIRRNIVIDGHKSNSWRFNCGVETFKNLTSGDAIIVRARPDGNLEVEIEKQALPIEKVLQSPFLEPSLSAISTVHSSNRIRSRPLLGEPLNFRGLQHAPINEQGVVFIFGMVCKDLGYLIEAVQSGFPDCEGKRRVNNNQNRWERVRIEFEFKSSNFQKHGHDISMCDLIVCWEDDWTECSIEVLELSTTLKKLDS